MIGKMKSSKEKKCPQGVIGESNSRPATKLVVVKRKVFIIAFKNHAACTDEVCRPKTSCYACDVKKIKRNRRKAKGKCSVEIDLEILCSKQKRKVMM